jgi:hypothetical protein
MFEKLKEAAAEAVGAGADPSEGFMGRLKGAAAGAVGAGVEKAQEIMREFNDTIPTIRALGLSVRNISFGMGLMPEIAATLIGSVDALDREKIDELLRQHQKNKTATFVLEALKTTSNLKEQLSQFGIRGIRVDLKLGVPPKVEVGLLAQSESAGAA